MYFSGPYKEDASILEDDLAVKQKRIIITGVSDSTGAAFALEMAKHPDKVSFFLTGKDADRTKAVADQVKSLGCTVQYEVGHIFDEQKMEEVRNLLVLSNDIDL
jgi:NADP-dependent 3-hydroxy acid dehydrogenase YdfG